MPLLILRIANEILNLNIWSYPVVLRLANGSIRNNREELSRIVNYAARESGETGAILIILDADDDCPAELGPRLLEIAKQLRTDRKIAVVLANREYESWFLAASESLGLPPCQNLGVRDAKGWIRQARGNYAPTVDQAGMTARFDLVAARMRSDSLDKLCREVQQLLS